METFANYILSEEDIDKKIEIVYYLQKKMKIFFDKSVVVKTELAKLFIEVMDINVDKNEVLTACLLYACQKMDNPTDLGRVMCYAEDGARFLEKLGFSERFCTICKQVNRYSKSEPRLPEGDILELVDQYGGMLLHKPERIAFKPDEALVLLEYRNLKDKYNCYLDLFKKFAEEMQEVDIDETNIQFTNNQVPKLG